MAKAFSVASWNVEHFGALNTKTKKPEKPIQPIIDFIADQKADIVAVYEVRSEYIYEPILNTMQNYQFYITEGEQLQEILIGVKKGISAFITQKIEFKSGQSTLRPGVLVTPLIEEHYYPVLFLHLKSSADPKGFGLRDDMLQRALKFRKILDEKNPNYIANYIFLGDLNTMGLDYPYKENDISSESELKQLDRRAKLKKMRRLSKSYDLSWWNGSNNYKPGSNLDHVIAAEHLEFKSFNGFEVDVKGWPQEEGDEKRREWINKYSDHGLLYFEVQKV